MSESHCSRLEDVGNLWIDCRVVPRSAKVSAVAPGLCIGWEAVGEPARDEDGEPFGVDNVLVGGNGEHTGTVVEPLVIFVQFTGVALSGSVCPKLYNLCAQKLWTLNQRIPIVSRKGFSLPRGFPIPKKSDV